MKRYFMIAYHWYSKDGQGVGNINIICKNGILRSSDAIKTITDLYPEFNNIIFSNIIEFTEENYNNWVS